MNLFFLCSFHTQILLLNILDVKYSWLKLFLIHSCKMQLSSSTLHPLCFLMRREKKKNIFMLLLVNGAIKYGSALQRAHAGRVGPPLTVKALLQ